MCRWGRVLANYSPDLRRRLLACLGSAAAVLVLAVPTASAADPPSITSVVAPSSPVSVGSPATITASVSSELYNTDYRLAIVAVASGSELNSCGTDAVCSASAVVPFSDNQDQTRAYRAEVRRRSTNELLSSSVVSVQFKRVEWSVTFASNVNPVTVGATATATATITSPLHYTGYTLRIRDLDTGTELRDCGWTDLVCSASVYPPFATNASPQPRNLRAEIKNAAGDGAGSADLTVDVEPRIYNVGLTMTGTSGAAQWTARATTNESVTGTGFSIQVRNAATNQSVRSCATDAICKISVGYGSYFATVEDAAGNRFGRSHTWTFDSAGATDQSAEGLDLFRLGTMYATATATAICDALLFGPGTHFAISSATDQTLACQVAAPSGKKAVLDAIKGMAGSLAVLWFLADYADVATDPGTGVVQPADPNVSSPPPPVRPVPPALSASTSEFNGAVDQLMAQNPGTFADRETADMVMNSCRSYVSDKSKCLSMPILVPAQDMPKTTEHNRTALMAGTPPQAGQPTILNWIPSSDRVMPRNWYSSNDPLGLCDEDGSCDEYPFHTTLQGGPGASLKSVPTKETQRQATLLSAFYRKCKLFGTTVSRPFIVAPAPKAANVPASLKICHPVSP